MNRASGADAAVSTIFASYKGGLGRTLVAVNLANLLSHLGCHVVLVDLDVDTPGGVLAKYGHKIFDTQLPNNGLVDFMVSSPRRADPAAIQALLIPITMPPTPTDGQPYGSIRVLNPGSPIDGDYWDNLSSPQWRRLVSPETVDGEGMQPWSQLRAAIEGVTPRPDFVFVDAPAGLSELATVAFAALADAVVILVGRDYESRGGGRHIVAGLPFAGATPPEAYLVDARYPEYAIAPHDSTREQELLDEFESFSHLRWVATLPALVGLEANPRMVVSLGLPVELDDLTRAYFVLAARLFPQAVGYNNPEHPILSDDERVAANQAVRSALENRGHPCVDSDTHKVFALGPRGRMVNLEDTQPNVSFKVKTFCGLLDDLHRDLLPEATQSAEESERPLERAGEVVGARFGEAMIQDVWHGSLPLDPKQRIKRWCSFDSKVGFGRFSLVEDETAAPWERTGPWVRVEDNFLAAGRGPADTDLCRLLVGYIRGVASALLQGEVTVDHPGTRCIRLGNQDGCFFHISIVTLSKE